MGGNAAGASSFPACREYKPSQGGRIFCVTSLKLSSNPNGGRLAGGNSCEEPSSWARAHASRRAAILAGPGPRGDGGGDSSLPGHRSDTFRISIRGELGIVGLVCVGRWSLSTSPPPTPPPPHLCLFTPSFAPQTCNIKRRRTGAALPLSGLRDGLALIL